MRRDIHIGTFSGIPLKIHWTFGFLVIYLALTIFNENVSIVHGLWFTAYVIALFSCVVLHEYGHAYAAKKYGVKTIDITLSPIGGIARLERLPELPKQELVVAIAGPLVNLLIAIITGFILYNTIDFNALDFDFDILRIQNTSEFLIFLFALNTMLFLFNLIPAFPMDGGRIIRALFAMKLGRTKATKLASIIGRILAIAFVGFGILNGLYILAFIGVFIYISAAAEYRHTLLSSVLEEHTLLDIMRKDFTKLHIGDDQNKLLDIYSQGQESNFLVFDSLGYMVGTIPEVYIKDILSRENTDKQIRLSQIMNDKIVSVEKTMPLPELYKLMNQKGLAIVPILDHGELIGVIDRRAFIDLLQHNSPKKA